MNNVWMGSWEECNAITRPHDDSYATQFCYVHLGSSFITNELINSGIISGVSFTITNRLKFYGEKKLH